MAGGELSSGAQSPNPAAKSWESLSHQGNPLSQAEFQASYDQGAQGNLPSQAEVAAPDSQGTISQGPTPRAQRVLNLIREPDITATGGAPNGNADFGYTRPVIKPGDIALTPSGTPQSPAESSQLPKVESSQSETQPPAVAASVEQPSSSAVQSSQSEQQESESQPGQAPLSGEEIRQLLYYKPTVQEAMQMVGNLSRQDLYNQVEAQLGRPATKKERREIDRHLEKIRKKRLKEASREQLEAEAAEALNQEAATQLAAEEAARLAAAAAAAALAGQEPPVAADIDIADTAGAEAATVSATAATASAAESAPATAAGAAPPPPPPDGPNHTLAEPHQEPAPVDTDPGVPPEENDPAGTTEGIDRQIADLDRQIHAIDEELGPLAAIRANFTEDRRDAARKIAAEQLDAEAANSKGLVGAFVHRIWKGTLFRRYFERRYTQELEQGSRKIGEGESARTLDEIITDRSAAAMERFMLGVTDEAFVHKKAGEQLEVDAQATEVLRPALTEFIREHLAELQAGTNLPDLKRALAESIGRSAATSRDNGRPVNALLVDNYIEVAQNAAMRVTHERGIEQVMAGFKAYNAEARDGVRTEAHRQGIDKIIDALDRRGLVTAAGVLAAGAGIATALTQTGAKALAGAGAGIGVSALMAGAKERNRITDDRVRMLRSLAEGESYSGLSRTEAEIGSLKGAEKKTARYEAELGGTAYDMRPASELTAALESALAFEGDEAERVAAIMSAIAEARVRVDFSDGERKDLISYSSAEKRGDERLALDIALAKAKKALSAEGRAHVTEMEQTVMRQVTLDAEARDRNFAHYRTLKTIEKTAKSAAFGAAIFFASQEIMAFGDTSKTGLIETWSRKLGLNHSADDVDASQTILAGAFGGNHTYEAQINTRQTYAETYRVSADDQAEIDRLADAGFKQVGSEPGVSTEAPRYVGVSPSDADARLSVVYDGWANNGTTVPDGNEFATRIVDGRFVSTMSGVSTMGNQTFDIQSLTDAGNIKGYLTIGGAKFEIESTLVNGQPSWGNNGIFTIAGTNDTIRAIGENGEKLYKYFEVAVDNSAAHADGLTHIIPLVTDIGSNSAAVQVFQGVSIPSSAPDILTFAKETPITATIDRVRSITTQGVAFAPPILPRTNLGAPIAAAPVVEAPTPAAAPESARLAPATEASNGATGAAEPAAPATPPANAPAAAPSATAPAAETPSGATTEPSAQSGAQSEPAAAPATPPVQPEQQSSTEPISEEENRILQESEQILRSANISQEDINTIFNPNIVNDANGQQLTDTYNRMWQNFNDAQRQAVMRYMGLTGSNPNLHFGQNFKFWYQFDRDRNSDGNPPAPEAA